MAPKTVNRSDLKIVYFHTTTQDEDENPSGCVVVHLPTGFSGIGEAQGQGAQVNLKLALNAMAQKTGIPLPSIEALFTCPQCGQERLPAFSGWKAQHNFEYIKDIEINNNLLGHVVVFKTAGEYRWYWLYLEDLDQLSEIEPHDSAYFVEDAIAAAEAEANRRMASWEKEDSTS